MLDHRVSLFNQSVGPLMDSRTRSGSLNDFFFQSLDIIFLISRFVGIFPCSYRNGQFSISIPLCFWSLLSASLVSLSTTYFNINALNPGSRINFALFKTLPQALVSLWYCLCFLILYLVGVTNSVVRMRQVNKILLILNEVDHRLDIFKIKRSRLQQVKYIAKTYFGGSLFVSLYYFHAPLVSLSPFLKVLLFVPFVCVWLCASQFTSLADTISLRLEETCAALNDFVLTRHFFISSKKLVSLSQVQDKLCDIYVILDHSYGWLITCVISSCFIGFFVPLYILLPEICKAGSGVQSNLIGLAISWFTISLYTAWQIVSTTSGITTKLRGFNLTLYKLMKSDKRNELLRNNKLRLLISMQREVVFTAKGFFTLDFSLIHWLVASATTYLVILMQIDILVEDTVLEAL